MKIIVCETVRHYHQIEVEEGLDWEEIMSKAKKELKSSETGYEAIENTLNHYGIEHSIEPNYCGTECDDIEIIDTIE